MLTMLFKPVDRHMTTSITGIRPYLPGPLPLLPWLEEAGAAACKNEDREE